MNQIDSVDYLFYMCLVCGVILHCYLYKLLILNVGLQHGEDTSVTPILRLFSNFTNFHCYIQKCLFNNTVQNNGGCSM